MHYNADVNVLIIQKDDQHISWEHLVRVFNRSQTASGLSLLPRLKKDHISLTSYSRMRVNLAAQGTYIIFVYNYMD